MGRIPVLAISLVVVLPALAVAAPKPVKGGGGGAAPATTAPGVECYTAPEEGFFANSCWVKGGKAVVVFGAQMLEKEANEAKKKARQDGQLELLVITHAHHDNYFGTTVWGEDKALTSEGIKKDLEKYGKDAWTHWQKEGLKAKLPNKLELPKQVFKNRKVIELGNHDIELTEIDRPASSPHQLIGWEAKSKILFAGNMVISNTHAWFGGDSENWLKEIRELQALGPAFVVPGNGPVGGPELLTKTTQYIDDVRQAVYAEVSKGKSPDVPKKEHIAAIVKDVTAKHPSLKNVSYLEDSVAHEWKAQKDGKVPSKKAEPKAPPKPGGGRPVPVGR